MSEKLMTTAEVCEFLEMPLGTLSRWRQLRQGPPGYRLGRHIRYRRADVETWLAAQEDSQEREAK